MSGTLAAGAYLLGHSISHPVEEFSQSRLQPFLDPLPIPEILPLSGRWKDCPYYEIAMTEFKQKLHGRLPPTKVWGYGGVFPGPMIEARRNQPIFVRWINRLPNHHLFPVDTNLHGAHPENPEVRTVVHLHGGRVRADSDGFPENWFLPGESQLYYYANRQRATCNWYHDHAIGITRLNVYAGLLGMYLIRDEVEDRLNLPCGSYEIPLILSDRSFDEGGQLRYPHQWRPMFFGSTSLVNGVVSPFLEVEPRKYRFRILNASNGRFYNLKLFRYYEQSGVPNLSQSGPPFFQIGTDGGLLRSTVVLNDPRFINSPRLLLGPAERADIIIDFSGYEGKSFLLHNNAKNPFRGFNSPLNDEVPLPQIMLFRVQNRRVLDKSWVPSRLSSFKDLDPSAATVHRTLTLDQILNEKAEPVKLLLNNRPWSDAPTETPFLNSTEIWTLVNLTGEAHPIHLHLVHFQILTSQRFDVTAFREKKRLSFTAPPQVPNTGWKDTVVVGPAEVVRVIAKFADYAGLFVWHCHILEHEDNDMMRPLQVLPA